jgi:exodeoxyribonuclease VII small subunit
MKLLKLTTYGINDAAKRSARRCPTFKMSKKIEKLTFEEAIERLGRIIESMEDGDTPLAELIARFEEGANLLKSCQKELREAELKIEKLNLETGNLDSFEDRKSDI